MRKVKNLTKAALEVINEINRTLRANRITDESNDLFNFGCQYLLNKDMYHGFNFFSWRQTPDKKDVYLTETPADQLYDCLQIYIGGGFTIGERLSSKMQH